MHTHSLSLKLDEAPYAKLRDMPVVAVVRPSERLGEISKDKSLPRQIWVSFLRGATVQIGRLMATGVTLPRSALRANIPMRLLLVDDHVLFSEALAALMAVEAPDLSVRWTSTLAEADKACHEEGRFDVILLDIRMPDVGGLDDLSVWLQAHRESLAVVLSGSHRRRDLERAIALGFHGYLPKTMGAKGIVSAIRLIAAGERFFPISSYATDGHEAQSPTLSERERLALDLLCKGATNKVIGRQLGIEESLTKSIIRSLCAKYGASNRTELVVKVLERSV